MRMDQEKGQFLLRSMELQAYSSVVSVMRAQGPLTEDTLQMLHSLRKYFGISAERHKAEVRRALNDSFLEELAASLNPSVDVESGWLREGKRTLPLLPEVEALLADRNISNNYDQHSLHNSERLLVDLSDANGELQAGQNLDSSITKTENKIIKPTDYYPTKVAGDFKKLYFDGSQRSPVVEHKPASPEADSDAALTSNLTVENKASVPLVPRKKSATTFVRMVKKAKVGRPPKYRKVGRPSQISRPGHKPASSKRMAVEQNDVAGASVASSAVSQDQMTIEGTPSTSALPALTLADCVPQNVTPEHVVVTPVKRRRGRPPKSANKLNSVSAPVVMVPVTTVTTPTVAVTAPAPTVTTPGSSAEAPRRKRGRPPSSKKLLSRPFITDVPSTITPLSFVTCTTDVVS